MSTTPMTRGELLSHLEKTFRDLGFVVTPREGHSLRVVSSMLEVGFVLLLPEGVAFIVGSNPPKDLQRHLDDALKGVEFIPDDPVRLVAPKAGDRWRVAQEEVLAAFELAKAAAKMIFGDECTPEYILAMYDRVQAKIPQDPLK